jgi:hypothetical protein
VILDFITSRNSKFEKKFVASRSSFRGEEDSPKEARLEVIFFNEITRREEWIHFLLLSLKSQEAEAEKV